MIQKEWKYWLCFWLLSPVLMFSLRYTCKPDVVPIIRNYKPDSLKLAIMEILEIIAMRVISAFTIKQTEFSWDIAEPVPEGYYDNVSIARKIWERIIPTRKIQYAGNMITLRYRWDYGNENGTDLLLLSDLSRSIRPRRQKVTMTLNSVGIVRYTELCARSINLESYKDLPNCFPADYIPNIVFGNKSVEGIKRCYPKVRILWSIFKQGNGVSSAPWTNES